MSEKLKINFTSGSIKKELDNEQQNSSERQQQHSCFYSSQTTIPSTILITNNYSSPQDDGSSSSINLNNDRILDLNNKASSITILTRNSSETDNTSNKMPTSTGGSTVVLDRINICINNHPIYCSRTQNSIQKSSLDSEASINVKENNFVSKTMTATSNTSVMPTPTGTTIASSSTTTTTAANTTGINSNNNNNSSSLSLRESSSSSSSSSSSTTTSSSTAITAIVKSETTISNEFSIGQDVLVQKKDGRFYLGTIIAISKCQALVKFDDNTDCWSTFEELTKLDVGGQSDEPMCVVCKKLNKNDVVEVCERCGRGYHRKCADGSFQKKGIWFCRRCTAPNGFKTKKIDYQTNNYTENPKKISYEILHKSQLPYNLDSLSWDNHHRVNLEQIYCYCGKNGEWYNKMLQCCKCQQWFHDKCVNCLHYPVFAGDRFYVFACTMCNNGKEFLRRLELKWDDVVHLVLFNVTLNNSRKYYHECNSIIPYAIDNWPMLQLQPSMRNLSAAEIRDNILKTLLMDNTRFKCGKEIKKGHSYWGLRARIPPPMPKLIISQDVELTDQYLKEHKKLNIIPFVPPEKNSIQHVSGNFDNESSSVTSDDEFYRNDVLAKTNNTKIKNDDNTINKKLLSNSINSTITTKESGGKIYCRRLSNLIDKKTNKINLNGFDSNDISDKSHDCLDYDDNSKEQDNDDDNFIKKREHNQNDKNNICKSLEISHTVPASSSNVTKHKRKRKLSSSGIHLLNNKKLKIENNTEIKISSSSSSSSRITKLLETKITNADIKNSQDIIEISDSSDETTSSRGTLDLIIPPPKNFQGRNNPFRLTTPKKNENNPKNSGTSSYNNNNNSTAAGQFRIVRTVKRKLSAKDIMIGPNKEVKRRRIRRLSGNVEVISTATSLQSLPKSAAFLPIRTDSKDLHLSTIRSTLNSSGSNVTQFINSSIPPPPPINIGSISNILNGRRLRQRRGKNYSENNSTRRNSCSGSNSNGNSSSSSGSNTCTNNGNISINNNQINILNTLNNTLSNSSSNQSSTVSLSDLKTSVHMYFGGINRILDGENFIVRAKRFTPDGKIQYLIEWEGVS